MKQKEFREKWGFIIFGEGFRNYDPNDEFFNDIDTLIEQVISERMPTHKDVEKMFPSGGLVEVTDDGKFNIPATIAMYDNFNRQEGAKWVIDYIINNKNE